MENLPNHIVLIPDGNRRWAKKRGLPLFLGHQAGAETTQKILQAALDLKIINFTFWACSVDNLTKRSASEVKFLCKLFEKYFKKLAKAQEIQKNQIKINVLGRWQEFFPLKAKQSVKEAIEKTRDHKKYQLTFLMAYSGLDEMTQAIKSIAAQKNKNPQLKIDGDLIKNNLWTKDLPPVDLVIRTGGEPHWSSGMMMWDIANAQFYFTETFYPAFSVEEFKKAIACYSQIERRMGN